MGGLSRQHLFGPYSFLHVSKSAMLALHTSPVLSLAAEYDACGAVREGASSLCWIGGQTSSELTPGPRIHPPTGPGQIFVCFASTLRPWRYFLTVRDSARAPCVRRQARVASLSQQTRRQMLGVESGKTARGPNSLPTTGHTHSGIPLVETHTEWLSASQQAGLTAVEACTGDATVPLQPARDRCQRLQSDRYHVLARFCGSHRTGHD